MKEHLIKFYLSWVETNSHFHLDKFAKEQGMTLWQAKTLIHIGRTLYNAQEQNILDTP